MKSLFSSAVSPALLHTALITLAILFGVASLAQNTQAQSQRTHTPAPGAQKVLTTPKGGTGSTCTSTNGQNTCVCEAKCEAKASNCSCYGVLPGKEKKPDKSLVAPGGPSKATCTSGDGQKVCPCGNVGCWAATKNCGCLTTK